MKLKKLIVPGILIILLISSFFYTQVKYLYMPYEYPKSELIWPEWHEFEKPLRLEICNTEWEKRCYYSEDDEDMKYILDSLSKQEYLTRSRKEYRELDFYLHEIPEDDIGYYFDNTYNVVFRHIDGYEDGHVSGHWVYSFDVYSFSKYVNGGHGTYYYYELPEDVRQFIFNAPENLEE